MFVESVYGNFGLKCDICKRFLGFSNISGKRTKRELLWWAKSCGWHVVEGKRNKYVVMSEGEHWCPECLRTINVSHTHELPGISIANSLAVKKE